MSTAVTLRSTPLSAIPAVPASAASDASRPHVAVLTRRLAAGDEAAFREFHALYFDRLYHFLLAVTRGDEHTARDAMQETLLRVARYVRPFDDEEIFWGWLRAVARSVVRDAGRKHRRYRALLERFMFQRGDPSPSSQSGAASGETNLHALLEVGLDELEADERQLIEGKYLRGLTVLELAQETGLTEKAVESRLGRVRRQLADTLLQKLRTR